VRKTECPTPACRPLSNETIRHIHFAISGALAAAVRWDSITSHPAHVAKKPRQPSPRPDPPSVDEATRIINAAWSRDEDWGTFVWLVMVTGVRRAEALALRWTDVDLQSGTLSVRRNFVRAGGRCFEKDTKTHQMRRLALDDTTVDILSEHRRRYDDLARELQVPAREDAFLFSHKPDRDVPYDPDAVSHRYIDMCAQLGINCHLHALRHYSATELLSSGVDLRTVAGRLGHGGGGTTTLRVYAAWVSESDKKAATILAGKIARPRRT
jgi:integrase